jgi:hypothetical protein
MKYGSIVEEIHDDKVDLTFTSIVLIHINPDYLDSVFANLVNGVKLVDYGFNYSRDNFAPQDDIIWF